MQDKNSDHQSLPIPLRRENPGSGKVPLFLREDLDFLEKRGLEDNDKLIYRRDDGSLRTMESKEITRWFKEAGQGKPFAQYNVGLMYFKGIGVAQNQAEALKWFRKAAEGGSLNGQGFLGILYENGVGVEQDHEESLKWYRQAAEQGNSVAE
ncbi:MAG: tetratricopeptide repeat protein, partial [Nitrospinaceae bacterium]